MSGSRTTTPNGALDMATPAEVVTRSQPASEEQAPTRPVELGAVRSDRRGPDWVSRHVSANGVICVSWQQICLGISHAGANVDVEVGEQLLQIWRGEELIKTVQRTSRGKVRKKKASVQQHGPNLA